MNRPDRLIFLSNLLGVSIPISFPQNFPFRLKNVQSDIGLYQWSESFVCKIIY